MPKKKSTRADPPRLSDALVMAVCLAGALLCLVFFQLDLNRTLSRLGEQPVGTITWKYRAAQRRFIDRVLWDRLQTESPVYHGDSIRTAALSEAAVTFPGGGVIDLGENSFIRIFVKDALPRLDLLEGNVSVAAGEGGFVLASGSHALTLGPGGAGAAGAAGGGGAEFHGTGGGASR
ncbi:MAG: FecR family protein, partial [Treponema sp.]|nr:FecR family protein [Treponema sp.]